MTMSSEDPFDGTMWDLPSVTGVPSPSCTEVDCPRWGRQGRRRWRQYTDLVDRPGRTAGGCVWCR